MAMVRDFTFLVSRITADSDCSHVNEKRLPPWKKSYDKLRQHLESRDITYLVKAMVFPGVHVRM